MDMALMEKDRRIDPNQLDIEAARQADRFFFWAEKYIEAKTTVEKLDFHTKTMFAKLSMQCRDTPGKFGLTDKYTEAGIKTAVEGSPQYIAAVGELLAAKGESMLLEKAVDAMEQRKRMIEVLITLHGQQYFAGPSVPRDLASAWVEYQEQANATVTDEQKNMTRKRVRREL